MGGIVAIAAVCSLWLAPAAAASAPHVVASGETLSGVAAANGLSAATLASWNGLDAEAMLIEGQTIDVPTTAEAGVGAAPATAGTTTSSSGGHSVVAGESLSSVAAANGITVEALAAANGLASDAMLIEGQSISVPAATPETAATGSSAPAPGLAPIDSPYGTLYLEAGAASSWNAMRDASLRDYGQDLYPAGPLSAYRTPDQQADLYEQYVDGTGAPANPPGYSSHQQGLSVDVATPEMRSVIDQIGGGFGWGKFEAPDEWWHVSYGG